MLLDAICLALGLFAWTLLEYVIHGPLSHLWATPVAPLHDVHHRDPHAVFTVGAWIPTAIIYALIVALFGIRPSTLFLTGLVLGFAAYEWIHYRIHFARPVTAFEARLRARHLAHHFSAPDACLGVTSALWDRAFGTEPEPAKMRALAASVAGIGPLGGPSNARLALSLGIRTR
jgi:dihydroceramide fatty acyl 2-hydroxylase